jgi:hypothetical protein
MRCQPFHICALHFVFCYPKYLSLFQALTLSQRRLNWFYRHSIRSLVNAMISFFFFLALSLSLYPVIAYCIVLFLLGRCFVAILQWGVLCDYSPQNTNLLFVLSPPLLFVGFFVKQTMVLRHIFSFLF